MWPVSPVCSFTAAYIGHRCGPGHRCAGAHSTNVQRIYRVLLYLLVGVPLLPEHACGLIVHTGGRQHSSGRHWPNRKQVQRIAPKYPLLEDCSRAQGGHMEVTSKCRGRGRGIQEIFHYENKVKNKGSRESRERVSGNLWGREGLANALNLHACTGGG